jgi:hypothetical protein
VCHFSNVYVFITSSTAGFHDFAVSGLHIFPTFTTGIEYGYREHKKFLKRTNDAFFS